ncbi:MAG: endonuclease/exonuclease/phosphatase family protein [Crocinitomicaceae bacterium]|nr:endonuclease/exonuclease/phosphatase family protein [Crocinitomicaceae bacterium]
MKLLITIAFIWLSSIGFSQTDTIHVMSWNVFLRPGILRDHQLDRVDSIAAYLNSTNADVLILQEVFHKKSRKRLTELLSEIYPYHTEVGKKSFWGVSSGVMIFSKHKIGSEEHVYYKKAKGSDRLAKKGAVLANITFKYYLLSFIGTHLQAGDGIKRREIRFAQVNQLSTLNSLAYGSIIYAGDFNIQHDSNPYATIVNDLETHNLHALSGEHLFTANFSDHELFPTEGIPIWIDFIFIKNPSSLSFEQIWIEEPRAIIDGEMQRISDHNPIHSKIILVSLH